MVPRRSGSKLTAGFAEKRPGFPFIDGKPINHVVATVRPVRKPRTTICIARPTLLTSARRFARPAAILRWSATYRWCNIGWEISRFNSEIRAKASIASWFMGFLLGSLSATSAGDVSTVGGAPSVDLPDCEPLRHT